MPDNIFGINWNKAKTNPIPPKGPKKTMATNPLATRKEKEKKGGGLKNVLLTKATEFAQKSGRQYICEGDMTSIKQRAIQAIQMMPDTMVAKMVKSSPICTSQSSMGSFESLFGGTRGKKTRKQKKNQKKTRKH